MYSSDIGRPAGVPSMIVSSPLPCDSPAVMNRKWPILCLAIAPGYGPQAHYGRNRLQEHPRTCSGAIHRTWMVRDIGDSGVRSSEPRWCDESHRYNGGGRYETRAEAARGRGRMRLWDGFVVVRLTGLRVFHY